MSVSHEKIIDVLKKLGYDGDYKGVCFGVAALGLQAILLNDMASFTSRLVTLSKYAIDDILPAIEKVENKRLALIAEIHREILNQFTVKNESSLNEEQKIIFNKKYQEELKRRLKKFNKQLETEERDLLTLRAFFQSIAVYQKDYMYSHLFEEGKRPMAQDVAITSQLLLPLALKKIQKIITEGKPTNIEVPAVKEVTSFCGAYTEEDLVDYFEVLSTTFKKINEPVTLLLTRSTHTISVGWLPERGWVLIDANFLSLATEKMDNIFIAKFVKALLSKNENSILQTQIFSRESNVKKLKNVLDEDMKSEKWTAIHEVNEKTKTRLDSTGASLLYMASRFNHVDIVKQILDSDLNQANFEGSDKLNEVPLIERSVDGNTPLIAAVLRDNTEIVKLLIEHKANIHQLYKQGESALYIAVKNNNLELTKLLIKHKLDINQTNDRGASLVYLAVQLGYTKILRYLIKKKADINKKDNQANTPLLAAIVNGRTEIVKLLVRNKADVNCANIDGFTPLILAVQLGNIEIIKYLIKKGVDINLANSSGNSPLQLAAKSGRTEIVKLLIKNGADINQVNHNNVSSLFLACQSGHIEIVNLLIQAKANPNLETKNTATSLLIAIISNHMEIVKILIDNGADINLLSSNGLAPLMIAVQKNRIEMVHLLLENNANIDQTNSLGSTPLLIAAQKGQSEVVKLLIANKAGIDLSNTMAMTPLLTAALYGRATIVDLLLQAKADINRVNHDGMTPLFLAAYKGHAETVSILIKANANPNLSVNFDLSILQKKAKEISREKEFAELLENMKSGNLKSFNGFTILHAAVFYGHTETVKALLKSKFCDVHAQSDGVTVFQLAEVMGYKDIIEELKDYTNQQLKQKNLDYWINAYKQSQSNPLAVSSFFSSNTPTQRHLNLIGSLIQLREEVSLSSKNKKRKFGSHDFDILSECLKYLFGLSEKSDLDKLDMSIEINTATKNLYEKTLQCKIDEKSDVGKKFKINHAK